MRCPICHGHGAVSLPHRSGTAYIPKAATVLTLIAEILERREQALVFSAFNDLLATLAVQAPAPAMPLWKLRVRARLRNPTCGPLHLNPLVRNALVKKRQEIIGFIHCEYR